MPIATRLGSVVTCSEELSPKKPYDCLTCCLVRSCDKLKTLYPHFHYINGYQT